MVRAPCCEKMGLKKGPWTPEEDLILINYIQLYGHGNWRALPKHAGLLRCGKSCRLRWTNYLRPDIKRGNFTREEEDTILKLHEMLGNRWSAIAARLPGRTDNEIKNVWHTHLKKRLKQNHIHAITPETKPHSISKISKLNQEPAESVNSPRQCSSEVSSVTTSDIDTNNNMCMKIDSSEDFPEMDEHFWSEVLSADNSSIAGDVSAGGADDQHPQLQFPFSPLEPVQNACNSNLCDSMDFWYNLLTRAGESLELPEI